MHANDATRTASHASRVRFGWSAHVRATERVDGTTRAYGESGAVAPGKTRIRHPALGRSRRPLLSVPATARTAESAAKTATLVRAEYAEIRKPASRSPRGCAVRASSERADSTRPKVVRRSRDGIAVDDGTSDRERETLENDRRGQDEHVRPDEEENDAEGEIELGESNGSRRESFSGRTRKGRADEDAPAESSDEEPDFAAGESLTSRGDDEAEEEAGDRDVADGVENVASRR